MSWSLVKKGRYPVKWWFHKLLCELAYHVHGSGKRYYYHLNKLCETGFTLYGEKI